MPRNPVAILAAAFVAAAVGQAAAQEKEPAEGSISPEYFSVAGIAKDDALNIRATASAIGMTIARVPNGTQFRNLGCEMARGYLWCKVMAVEDERMIGWAPGRYLPGAVATDGSSAEAAATPAETAAGEADDGLMGSGSFDVPGKEAEKPPLAAGTVAGAGETVVPSGMGLPGIIQRPYSADAKGVVASLPDLLPLGEAQDTAKPAEAASAPRAAAVDAGAGGAATGAVPCARYLGQPMAMCRAMVAREGEGAAAVTVEWPDGGSRVIRFRDGKADGSDSSLPLQATREADLNMIRIGKTERFEITDALAFGG